MAPWIILTAIFICGLIVGGLILGVVLYCVVDQEDKATQLILAANNKRRDTEYIKHHNDWLAFYNAQLQLWQEAADVRVDNAVREALAARDKQWRGEKIPPKDTSTN